MSLESEDTINLTVIETNNDITVNPNAPINNINNTNIYGGDSNAITTGNADLRYYPLNNNPSAYLAITSGISGYLPYNNGNSAVSWMSPISPKWCILREDFIGGTNADGQRGELGWRGFTIGGAPTFNAVDPSAESFHHGIVSVTTNSTINHGGALSLSDGSQPQITNFNSNGWDSYFIFKVTTSNPQMRFRLGFSNSVNAGGSSETNRGIWLRYDKDASYGDTGYYFVCRDNAVNQQYFTNVAPDTNWHTLRMWCENTGYINFSLDNVTGSVTNTSNAGAKIPHLVLLNSTAASNTAYLDYFGFMGYCNR